MKRLIASLLASVWVLSAQTEVKLSQQPENIAYTQILVYSGTNVSYICTAQSLQNPSQIAVSTISNANPGVVTATAHGMYFLPPGTTGARVVVFISGATGGWASINGTHATIPVDADHFTFGVDTTAFGSFSGQSIIVTTKAPLTTKSIWTVQSFVSDASGNPVFIAYRADATTTSLGTLGSGSSRPNGTCTAPTAYQ